MKPPHIDPIGMAVEAAGDALHAAYMTGPDSRDIASAAIVAFLRALPDNGSDGVEFHGVPVNRQALAAAVEQAREGK